MKYEIASNSWSSIAPLPEAVNFCKWSTTTVNNLIVLVGSGGGYTQYPSNLKVFYYNTTNNTWTYDSDVPSERGLALGFYMPSRGKLFFGGGNIGGASTNYQATCWTGDGGFIPVELISFNTSVNNNEVILNWSTASEKNNSHFEIQKSIDGIGFTNIGIVVGSGTTTETKDYSFNDKDVASGRPALPAGRYFYRLKQVDYDGSFNLSNIIEAEITSPENFELSQNYPNPFNPTTSIQYAIGSTQSVSLRVYDVLGNEIITLVNEYKAAGSYEMEFDASSLSSGMYIYKLTATPIGGQAGSFTSSRKLVLIK